MILLRAIAAIVFFMQLPVPLYWFVLHPGMKYWRSHRKAAYMLALACSWLPVTICLFVFHSALFSHTNPSALEILAGLVLIGFEVWMFARVRHDLGDKRLVGHAEILAIGEIESRGVYRFVRHPRYAASFLALIGACLLAASQAMWLAVGMWVVLTLCAIAMEEREMRVRFGAAYDDYARRVPRFLPSLTRQRE